MGWTDLPPDPQMLIALNEADAVRSRQSILEEAAAVACLPDTDVSKDGRRAMLRNHRKRWSEVFADACARMVASELRRHSLFKSLDVRPTPTSGIETFTPLGSKKGKRIDVVAFGPLVGLQAGVSLKGSNFRDDYNGNYDKNLTGRLYEVRDEVSVVHRALPAAHMTCLYFVPFQAVADKTEKAPSSFAHVVSELAGRSGRLDPGLASHADRLDWAAVGLYVPGDLGDPFPRGVVRYFDVRMPPPRRGRPKLESTLDLQGFISALASSAAEGTSANVEYSEEELP